MLLNGSFTYDEFSKVLTLTEAGNTDLELFYDNLGRMLTKKNNLLSREIRYVYDRAGRRTQLQIFNGTQQEGDTLIYQYDDASRIQKVARNEILEPEASYVYDLAGRLTLAEYGNGCTTDYICDDANRLLTVENKNSGDSVISKFEYVYDDTGNRITLDYTFDDAGQVKTHNISYGYDALYQLTAETRTESSIQVYQQSFTYDLLGNRETKIVSVTDGYGIENLEDGTWTYDHNELNQFLTETKGSETWNYEYDTNGSLTRKENQGDPADVTTYSYDTRNRMNSVALPSGDEWEYTYDAFGRRIMKHLNDVPQAERYLYDGDNVLMDYEYTESSGDLTEKAQYNTPGLDANLSVHKFDGSGDLVLFYMSDGLGSIRNMVDDTGLVVQKTIDYDAWGVNVRTDNPGNLTDRYNFTARELDETGLHYYRARYYNTATGRFLQLDTLESINRYAYCSNNPVNDVDPYGLQEKKEAAKKVKVKVTPGGIKGENKYGTIEVPGGMARIVLRSLPSAHEGTLGMTMPHVLHEPLRMGGMEAIENDVFTKGTTFVLKGQITIEVDLQIWVGLTASDPRIFRKRSSDTFKDLMDRVTKDWIFKSKYFTSKDRTKMEGGIDIETIAQENSALKKIYDAFRTQLEPIYESGSGNYWWEKQVVGAPEIQDHYVLYSFDLVVAHEKQHVIQFQSAFEKDLNYYLFHYIPTGKKITPLDLKLRKLRGGKETIKDFLLWFNSAIQTRAYRTWNRNFDPKLVGKEGGKLEENEALARENSILEVTDFSATKSDASKPYFVYDKPSKEQNTIPMAGSDTSHGKFILPKALFPSDISDENIELYIREVLHNFGSTNRLLHGLDKSGQLIPTKKDKEIMKKQKKKIGKQPPGTGHEGKGPRTR